MLPFALVLAIGFVELLVFQLIHSAEPTAQQSVIYILEWLSPLSIKLTFALWCVVVFVNWRRHWRHQSSFGRHDLAWLGSILLIAGLARGLGVPFQHRVYYDEDVYLQIARGICAEGRSLQATAATLSVGEYHCLSGVYPKWPNGWATLLSLLFRLLGPSEITAFATNFGVSLIHIALVAVLARQLFPSDRTWLFATAIFAALPANAIWGSTAAVDPAAAAFNTGTLLAFLHLGKNPLSKSALLLAVATGALAMQFRAESLLILIAAVILLLLGTDWDTFGAETAAIQRRYCYGALLFFAMLLPHVIHLGLISIYYDPAMGEGVGFNVKHILPNLASNASYFVEELLMVITTVLAVLGVLFCRRHNVIWVLVLWFFLFFTIFIGYFVGSYRLPGLERYVLLCLAPYAILAARGLDTVSLWATQKVTRLRGATLPRALAAGFFIGGALATPGHVQRWDEPTRVLSEEHNFLRIAMAKLPPDAIVLFPIPSVIINIGRSSAWPYPNVDMDILEELARNAEGELYLYSGIVPWENRPESTRLREWYNQCKGRPIFTTLVDSHQLTVYQLCEITADLGP